MNTSEAARKLDLTVVCGLDAVTIRQIVVGLPTWNKYHPWLFDCPWLVFFDRSVFSLDEFRRKLADTPLATSSIRAMPWPPLTVFPPALRWCPPWYATQRERMLTGFVYAPEHVATDWWVKIDADSVCVKEPPRPWPAAEWFEPHVQPAHLDATPYDSRFNVWIASRWGYTKPAYQMMQLDEWGDRVPEMRGFPRLDIPVDAGKTRVRHGRMASWLSFYRTDWSKFAARLARQSVGEYRIPVPSQDGYHFYVAARRGDYYVRSNQKRYGWTNCPRQKTLEITAAKAMGGE